MGKLSSPISLVKLCLNLLPKRVGNVYIEREINKYRIDKKEYPLMECDFGYINKFSKIIAYKISKYRDSEGEILESCLLILFDINKKIFFKSYLNKNDHADLYSIIHALHLITRYIGNESVIKIVEKAIPDGTVSSFNYYEYRFNTIPYNDLFVIDYYSCENSWITKILLDKIEFQCQNCFRNESNKGLDFYNEYIENGTYIKKVYYGFCDDCRKYYLKCNKCNKDYHTDYCKICCLCCKIINKVASNYGAYMKFLNRVLSIDGSHLSIEELNFIHSFCEECSLKRFDEIKKLYNNFQNKFMPSKIKMKIYDMLKYFNMDEYMDKFI